MTLFTTHRTESRRSFWYRYLFNIYPMYKATGARVKFLSADFQEAHILLTRNILTRNILNTIFGGSIYSSIDPIFMLQIQQILGKDYVVWDKAATIRFVRPARKRLIAQCLVTDEQLTHIRATVAQQNEMDLVLPLEYFDETGKVAVQFSKTIYIANQAYYAQKRATKGQNSAYKKIIG